MSAAVLAGCGGSDDPAAKGEGDGKVTFQVFGDAEELAIYREVIAGYQKASGKKVQLIEAPDRDAHLQKLITSFAAGRAPDVFLINYRNFGPYVTKGALDPVGPRLDASKALKREDYYESPLEAFTWKGELTCIPQNASSLVVYYNRALFKAAGVPEPEGDWTWDEFLRTALRLREGLRGGGERKPLGADPALIRLAPFVWAAGGELVDDLDAPTRFDFRTPAARRGIDRFLSLYRENLVPTELDVEAQALDERFIEGKLAMFMSSRREVPAFRSIKAFEWDIAPFPQAERKASVLHSDAFCLAKKGDADEAWKFVEYAAGLEGQKLLAQGGRTVPSLKSVAESPDYLRPDAPPRNARAFLDALEGLQRLPNTEQWPQIEDSATLAFKRAFYSELTVEAAIDRIEAETSGAF
jgi:multiple sugar transport system substrate-binding protein